MENLLEIEVKHHIKMRYCERIIGLETVIGKDNYESVMSITNPKTRKAEIDANINAYIALNDERIMKDIRTMFTYSEYICKGQFGGDNTSKRFFLRDDIILVVDMLKPVLITLYRVDFGFGEKNSELVKWMRDSIINLRDQLESIQATVEDFIITKQIENLEYDEEIRNMESRLEALRKLKKANLETIDAERSKIVLATRELDSKVHQLCNIYDYRRDMLEEAK